MKIALIGYGKMGKEIEMILLQKGHEVVLKITSSNVDEFNEVNLRKADVAIEFTTPHTAVENIKKCIHAGVPVVTGSTGWYASFDEIKSLTQEKKGSFFYATNFSIGVNIFFKMNEWLSKTMNQQGGYTPSMWEQHHIHKKDHPSGTAHTLAEGVINHFPEKKYIQAVLEDEEKAAVKPEALEIICSRAEEVPGTHSVTWTGNNDQITITHEAFNRKGFAAGAVTAAEWLVGKTGIYNMNDLLKL